ncbi:MULTISPECIES: Fur-regulated basic protein FbpA [unclassified Bacillus (in: firmicutes)]|uniref:Fur-regulated basic protein FbpA n=1 Tax=unclassified Bacillus (in: firmicutes) TaxID=185979 RepID=UPI0008E03BBC|nr:MULTISPECIES: Fur-regulated basic protein FbpA [unclassified Bacillus (in: firmicutes)]SFI02950.1 Fur-regulated basic protein A [Bacillus sp. 71mf]SFS81413.1 Fur-regulated basic protein A [Bacillus sp. 103mf]
MLLRQEVERRRLLIIRKLLGLGLAELSDGRTLDQLTLTQLEEILGASLKLLEDTKNDSNEKLA